MRGRLSALLATVALCPAAELRVEPATRSLHGAGAMQQFLAIAHESDGSERDVTGLVRWSANAPGGLFTASQNGAAAVTAALEGRLGKAVVEVAGIDAQRPFTFGYDIGAVLTRSGCNNSNCHGGVKGRGGFKLSSGALHPKDDYEWIVKGGTYQVLTNEVKGERIPRIDVNAPANSLLLRKATGAVPHGGGMRFRADSAAYRILLDWIRKGAPYGPDNVPEAAVVRLEVFPPSTTVERGTQHRLLVTAHLAGGGTEDFTRSAVFVSNNGAVATVSDSGLVTGLATGETAILVRAAGGVTSAVVGVVGPPLAGGFPSVAPANFVDEFVFDKLRRFRVPPSPLSTDAEFIRRVSLDLAGTLPPPARVREFVASGDPNKRRQLIDTLLATPEFTDYLTFRFDDVFRVAVFSNGIDPKWSQMYGEWVRASIAANKPYDQIARERLTAQGYDGPSRHYLPYDVIGPPGETMAEEVRVFFGRRLDCAQCHNHPHESWSQDQFWGMAAFFGRLFKMGDQGNEYVIFDHPLDQGLGNGDVNGSLTMYHPRSKAELKPTLLDGGVIQSAGRENPRKALADWMTKHPYFAEAAVNRVWGWYFGRGLVDPVDDFRSTNPPTHPELLARLAEEFRAHGHDLRWLIRTLVSSRTYQLSSRPTDLNRGDLTNYSHAQPRPLEAEVLLDAISAVTGVPETFSTAVSAGTKNPGQAPPGTRAINLREPDLFYSRFLEIYGRPNRLTLPERSTAANLGQALDMLAGGVYNDRLGAPDGRLMRLVKAGKSNGEIVDEIYLAAYARPPTAAEAEGLTELIGRNPDRLAALKDFVWAVLCSREFAENH